MYRNMYSWTFFGVKHFKVSSKAEWQMEQMPSSTTQFLTPLSSGYYLVAQGIYIFLRFAWFSSASWNIVMAFPCVLFLELQLLFFSNK